MMIEIDASDNAGPARGFGYTVSWVFFIEEFGIFCQNVGIKYFPPEFLVFCI